MKKIVFAALAALMVLGLYGCSGGTEPPAATITVEPSPAVEEDITLALVNGSPILNSTFQPVFLNMKAYYEQYGLDFSDETVYNQLQDLLIEQLIQSEVILQEAAKLGIALTADEEAEIEARIQADYDETKAYLRTQAESEGAEDIDARAQELLDEALAANGLTEEGYIEEMRRNAAQSAIVSKLQEALYADITVSEDEAKAAFEDDLAADKETYTATPAQYESDLNTYTTSGGKPPLFVPEGYIRVKHILVEDESLANALIERIEAGEDFDALVAEYGTDPGMQREPAKTEGYLLGEGTSFVQEFKDAAFALENEGDITAPVKSTYGYHVIKYEKTVESRELTFDEVKDAYMAYKLSSTRDTLYQQQITAWVEQAEIERFTDAMRAAGQ